MSKAVVTKGNRITLARNVRERLGIREGDKLVLNVAGSVLMISKKNAKILMNSINSFKKDSTRRCAASGQAKNEG
ncbi:MAG TPA: AbrB/MazE/SpoVT family DNA-binding domain-containing protein [archaeon]|nr:AbrB/MazE/SpoVT family DNA-binding domain-containing protein [archaeon]